MHLYPTDLFAKLEFDKILDRLSGFCLGLPAKNRVLNMKIYNSVEKITTLLEELIEFQHNLDSKAGFPHYNYDSIKEELLLLQKQDYVLEIDSYMKLFHYLHNVQAIVEFFDEDQHIDNFPLLYGIRQQIELDGKLIKTFDNIFTEEGAIKPNASSALAKIFKAIKSKESELEQQFMRLAKKYKTSGYLTDNIESFKNSRRVLSVNVENKRKIKGIIHDESSTGKTVFIEPQEVIQLNNDLFELEAQKRHEVYKILKGLSNFLSQYLEPFSLWQKILIRYDIIAAKAKFAKRYNGQKPGVSNGRNIDIKSMYHPLLYLINEEAGKKTVPFDLELNSKERILVISGPNAGGKSVTLKSMGLNQLMLQSGMLIPASKDSEFIIFDKMMIDIGDQQSLEGDLSTYSSRLMHMKHFCRHAENKTLVLMDEFGSGSDPKMGGAIAEAVLNQLETRKCYGLITTHYSNIKNYAFNSPSILNGAMLFDKEELNPSYELRVGQPGSSFAFEIADKIGLGEDILAYAKNKAGKDSKAVDQLLVELQHEKQLLEEKLSKTQQEQDKLMRLIKNYEEMKAELDVRRKKLKLEAKEKKYLKISDTERELQAIIKELRKSKNIERAEIKLKELKEKKQDTKNDIRKLNAQVFQKEFEKVKDLKLGQFVKLRSGGESGKVIAFNEKKVKLEIGVMEFEVPRTDIFLAEEPIQKKRSSIVTDTLHDNQSFEASLDIRGYTKVDALNTIQEFLDNALLSNQTMLKVLHGKGSGVLRKTLWEKAKEYKDIKKIWHPEDDFGGQGVTFISL